MKTMYEEIDRRIRELRRADWRWVKGPPDNRHEMCAVIDRHSDREKDRLSDRTQVALNKWISRYSGERWPDIIAFNDSARGARSVDDVIEMLEKFRAEL